MNAINLFLYFLGGKTMNYFDGILSNNDILNTDEYILMQQDLNNTEDNKIKMYQLILGNYNFLHLIFIFTKLWL